MIRKFIDNFLALSAKLSTELYKIYGQEIKETIGKNLEGRGLEKYTIFHLAAKERNCHNLKLLIKALISKNYSGTLNNLLKSEDMYNRTPFLIAIEYGYLDVLDTLWVSYNDISKIQPESFLKSVLLSENSAKQSMWSFAIENNKVASLDWLVQHIKAVNLEKHEIKNLFLLYT